LPVLGGDACCLTAIDPWLSSENSHLVTPDGSRATTPVEVIETFDPSRPSVSPGNAILLETSKITGYLDAALKELTLHTEARTSFITYASSLLTLLPHKSHQETFLLSIAIFFLVSSFN